MIYKCDLCGFESTRKDKLKQHLATKKHFHNSCCKNCDFVANSKTMLYRHKRSCKGDNDNINFVNSCHGNKIHTMSPKKDQKDQIIEKLIGKIVDENTQLIDGIVKINANLSKNVDTISNNLGSVSNNAITTTKTLAQQYFGNMRKIVERFPDAPPIQKMPVSSSETLLDEVISHITDNSLDSFFGNAIISVYKKEDGCQQSMWTADCSRLNYAVKLLKDNADKWISDKGGKVMGSYVITPTLEHVKHLAMAELCNPVKFTQIFNNIKDVIERRELLNKLIDMVENGSLETGIAKFISPSFSISLAL